jgi:hypothetical protein
MGLSRRIRRMRQPLEEETPHHLRLSPLLNEMKLNSLRTKECNSSKSMNCRTGSTRNEKNLRLLQQTLEQERAARAHSGGARERARDINRRGSGGRTPGLWPSQPECCRGRHASS